MRNIYSLSDTHLDSLAIEHRRTYERRLVRFLSSIRHKAAVVCLLGDMLGFRNEYKYVVPKGFTRFLGKIPELTDMEVEVYFFAGNYDLWTYGYSEKEYGVTPHRKPTTTEVYDKMLYFAHGDRLGDPDSMFRFLRKAFYNRFCRRLLSFSHPWWGMRLGLNRIKGSRLKHKDRKEVPYLGEDKECPVQYMKEYISTHRDTDYYIYGYRYIELDLALSRRARLLILGDWIWRFIYAVFDGEHMFPEEYVEGESKP